MATATNTATGKTYTFGCDVETFAGYLADTQYIETWYSGTTIICRNIDGSLETFTITHTPTNHHTQENPTMTTPESLTEALAKAMEGAGYGISDQLYNALEAEFAEALEVDQEDGDFTSIDTFLGALAYATGRVSMARSNQ